MTQTCMQFTLDDDQQAIADLAADVLAGHSTDEQVVRGEADGSTHDAALWAQVIRTGLLESALPESAGGAGLGMVGLSLVLREQGKRLARIPLATTGVAALALAELGGPDGVLEAIAAGTARVAAVVPEHLSRVEGMVTDEGWTLGGGVEVGYVAQSATHLLVPFIVDGAEQLVLVEVGRDGVSRDPFRGISRNGHAAITFRNVAVGRGDLVGAQLQPGAAATWVRLRLLTAAAAIQSGVCTEAVRRTALYTSEREQFGRPLSTNQGVALRAADAYIDTEAISLTSLDAAWQLDHGDDATEAVLSASWWAREGGFRVVHATQHLHGGMGADTDNHIHRFFLWAREIDVLWGSAASVLEELGALGLEEVSS